MRTRPGVIVTLMLSILFSGWAMPSASAAPPPPLDSGFITDTSDALSTSEEATVNARLAELRETANLDLYVVIVDEFTDPSDREAWANVAAEQGNLGPDQYLLALAVEERNYYISAHQDGPLSFDRVTSIEQSIRPFLSAEDWDGAILKAADEFQGGDAFNWGGILVFLLIAAAVVLVIWLIARSRKKKRGAQPPVPDPNDPFSAVSDEDLTLQAGTALVQADDAITSSREDLGFAVAEFGEASTEQFTQVVEAAKAKISEAFALKQQLDDEIPDSPQQRRAWHIQILQLCDAADDLLDDNVEAFDELRKLEQEAPQALERVTAQRDAARHALVEAPAALAALTGSYDAAALSTVTDNPDQAQTRLALADAQIVEATQALGAGKSGEAAFAIRTAEEAVAQATQLITAVTSLQADLAAVESQAKAMIADLEADLAAAAQLPDPESRLAPIVARTRAHLAEAQSNLEGSARSPQRMLETLDSANTQIDTAIAEVRDGVQREQRNRQLLEQRLLQAQSQVSAANEYIATRRGAVGATPRTRLAEASAALNQAFALQATDTTQALNQATRAHQLAREAISSAEREVSSFDTGGFGGSGGGSWGGNQGGGLGSDILGGIIGGILAGGGGSSSRSRSGGSSWRSSGSSNRGFRPSSFGGSRGGGRSRSGGGRF